MSPLVIDPLLVEDIQAYYPIAYNGIHGTEEENKQWMNTPKIYVKATYTGTQSGTFYGVVATIPFTSNIFTVNGRENSLIFYKNNSRAQFLRGGDFFLDNLVIERVDETTALQSDGNHPLVDEEASEEAPPAEDSPQEELLVRKMDALLNILKAPREGESSPSDEEENALQETLSSAEVEEIPTSFIEENFSVTQTLVSRGGDTSDEAPPPLLDEHDVVDLESHLYSVD